MIRPQQGKIGTTKGFKELKIRILVEKVTKGMTKLREAVGSLLIR